MRRLSAGRAGRVLLSALALATVSGCAIFSPKSPEQQLAERRQDAVSRSIQLFVQWSGQASPEMGARNRWSLPVRRRFHQPEAITDLYRKRAYAPIWIQGGLLTGAGRIAIAKLEGARDHGLDPRLYRLKDLRELLGRITPRTSAVPPDPDKDPYGGLDVAAVARFEITLTDGLLQLASDLMWGRVDPDLMDPEWTMRVVRKTRDELLSVADEWPTRISDVMDLLEPQHPAYQRLKDALKKYRELAKGWKGKGLSFLSERATVEPTGPAARRLAALLRHLGDLQEGVPGLAVSDPTVVLTEGIKHFQKRHGLTPDGILRAETREALQISLWERVRALELNLERWRWLPRSLGEHYVVVNIADYSLSLIDSGKERMYSQVLVGKDYMRTPVFASRVGSLVFNPTWTVPASIVHRDLEKAVKRDPEILKKRGIVAVKKTGGEWAEIPPEEIDWDPQVIDNYKVLFRQEAGPRNPLGKVKILFPNPFDVYLHDSPDRKLFKGRDKRQSSGCLRVQRAMTLAHEIFMVDRGVPPDGLPGFDPDDIARRKAKAEEAWQEIQTRLDSGETWENRIREEVDVYVVYLTAWADRDGGVQFRKDIYGRDQVLDRWLKL